MQLPNNRPKDDALDSTTAGAGRCCRRSSRRILAQPLQQGSHLGTRYPRCPACCSSSSRGAGASCAWAGGGAALGACLLGLLLWTIHQATLCWQPGLGQVASMGTSTKTTWLTVSAPFSNWQPSLLQTLLRHTAQTGRLAGMHLTGVRGTWGTRACPWR